MPTPQELKKISEAAALAKSKERERSYTKHVEEKVKRDAEADVLAQEKAKVAIAHAESNMAKVAEEGLSAALVYQAEGYEIVEQELRSLHSGANIDSPDRYFCGGAAKIVFDYFKDKGFNVVMVSYPGPADAEGRATKKFYVKVGW